MIYSFDYINSIYVVVQIYLVFSNAEYKNYKEN